MSIKNTSKLQPVILCGGAGRRLWPLSNYFRPKAFIRLNNGRTMIGQTLHRFSDANMYHEPFVVANKSNKRLISRELKGYNGSLMLESAVRNTALAIIAACDALKEHRDPLIFAPIDHIIENTQRFHETLHLAADEAQRGKIVTLGINPTTAEIRYGYIEAGQDGQIVSFHEKPDLQTAEKYMQQTNMFWNSGIFVASPRVVLFEAQKYAPDIVEGFYRYQRGQGRYKDIPARSFDHAVMEKTRLGSVISADIGWQDIGTHESLFRVKHQLFNRKKVS